MKKGRVISFNKRGFYNLVKNDRIMIFLYSVFIISLILGILTFSQKQNTYNILNKIFTNFLNSKVEHNYIKILQLKLLEYMSVNFLVLIIGVSLFGIVSIPLFTFVFGYLVGNLISLSYFRFGVKGIAYNAIIILPSLVVYVCSLLLVLRYIFDFSVNLTKLLTKRDGINNIQDLFFKTSKKFGILLVVSVIVSVLDSSISYYLIKIFDFII